MIQPSTLQNATRECSGKRVSAFLIWNDWKTWPYLEMMQCICQEIRPYEGMTGWLSWWYPKNRGILNIPNSTMCQMGWLNHLGLHFLELTYPPKMQVFNRNLLSQGSIFRGSVVLKFAGKQMVRLPIPATMQSIADEILPMHWPPDMRLKNWKLDHPRM